MPLSSCVVEVKDALLASGHVSCEELLDFAIANAVAGGASLERINQGVVLVARPVDSNYATISVFWVEPGNWQN